MVVVVEEGMVVEMGWFPWLTSDQLEESENLEVEICQKGTWECPFIWAPAWVKLET